VQGGAEAPVAREIADTRRRWHLRGGQVRAAAITVGDGEGQRRSREGTRADGHGVRVDIPARGGGGHRPRRGHRGNDGNGGGGGDEPHRGAVEGHGGRRCGPFGAHTGIAQRQTTETTGRVAVEKARWLRREGEADPVTAYLCDSVRLGVGEPAGRPAPFNLHRPR